MKENNMAFTPRGHNKNQSGFDSNPVDYSGDYSSQDNDDYKAQPSSAPMNNNTEAPTTTTPTYVRTRRFGENNATTSNQAPNPSNQGNRFAPRSAEAMSFNQRPAAQPSQYANNNSPSNRDNQNNGRNNGMANGGTQRFNQSEHPEITQQAQNRRNSAFSNFIPAGAPYQRSAPSLAYQEKVKANNTNMRFSYWGNARTNNPMRYPLEIEKPLPFTPPAPIARPIPTPMPVDESNIPMRKRSGFEEPLEMPAEKIAEKKPVIPAYHVNRTSDPEKNHAPLPESYKLISENEQMGTLFNNEKIITSSISTVKHVRMADNRFSFLPVIDKDIKEQNLQEVHAKLLVKIDEEQNAINLELERLRIEQAAIDAANPEVKKVKKPTKKELAEANNSQQDTSSTDNNNIEADAPLASKDNVVPKKRAPNTNFKPKTLVDGSQFQTQNNHNFEGTEIVDLEKTGLHFRELLNLANIQTSEKARFNIQELSAIPTELLLEVLGAVNEKGLWILDRHTIQLQEKSFKWFNQSTNKGSTGSINLMKHLIAIESDIVEHENDSTLFKASCQKLTALLPELFNLYDKKNADSSNKKEEERKQQYQKLIKAIDSLPLLDVMSFFQGKNHHKGIAGRWKVNSNGNVYSAGSNGWFSFTESVGGHGAIGFAAHVMASENNLNYNDKEDNKKLRRLAINMLKQEFKNDIDLDASYDDVPVYSGDYKVPFSMPLVIPKKQNQVRNYLHDKRGLPNWIINKQMAAGLLFPGFPSDWKLPLNFKDVENLEDKNVWAVFLAMNGNAAEMRAIDRYDGTAKLLAKGSEKEAGGHLVKAEKELSEGMICSLEAAIDACSYSSIFPGRVTNSCMGVNYNLAASMAVETLDSGYRYGFCFDNDLAGNLNNLRFKDELIKRIGEDEYNDYYQNNKIEYFQLGILCLKEQFSLGQRFYFDVNYDEASKNTFNMFYQEAEKVLGQEEFSKMYQKGKFFSYNVTPNFNLIKDNNIQSEAIRVADILLNDKNAVYFVTEEPKLDRSEADIPEKIEDHKISLIKHHSFMEHFKNHLGNNYLALQKQGTIIKNINSFAKDWNEYLNKMKKLHPEFAQQQQDFEDKFADTYTSNIQLEKVAGKIKKKR